MPKKLRVVLAQLNLLVGDIAGNLAKHIHAATTARDELQADVIVFPELSLTGYPPEDLLLRKSFIKASDLALKTLQDTLQDIYCLVGHPQTKANSKTLFNACSLIHNGKVLACYTKQHLPNYGVFDEKRYFVTGRSQNVTTIKGIPVGICICEDLWFPGPAQQVVEQGARIILSPNASPFEIDKHHKRATVLERRAKANHIPIVYVNFVGGQDDLIFDGGSMVIDPQGQIAQLAPFFQQALVPVDFEFDENETRVERTPFELPTDEEKVYEALVLGVRDYVKKNHFNGALIGLSGGIDSVLTLAIAVDALGKENISAVMMPSRYTADMSLEDAAIVAKNFGVDYKIISIENTFTQLAAQLEPMIDKKNRDITLENLQARCRGVIMMALSNSSERIVLTTGNRSEMAVGYATLYGDMAGGFAVLKDVPKTWVYRLAGYRNRIQKLIPQRVIDRAPSAELAPNQKDSDTLPPYPVLDKILELYLNQGLSAEDIIAHGHERALVSTIISFINRSEYKRRQAAVGTRINHTAFGRDRRYPITNGFKG
jgi:NAD+ synthase (glutamine-hydrolysing)